MRKKPGAVVFLVTGLIALIFSDMGGNLISQAFAESTAKAQKKAAKSQVVDASRTIKAIPGTPDGVLLMQAHALFGKLPATMPGSEQDTPAMTALGKKLYFEEAISINRTQSCNSCHPIDNSQADRLPWFAAIHTPAHGGRSFLWGRDQGADPVSKTVLGG